MSRAETIERLRTTPATGANAKVEMREPKAATNPRLGMIQRRHAESLDEARDRATRTWREFDRCVSPIDPYREALEIHIAYKLETDASFEAAEVLDAVSADREHLKEVAAKLAQRGKSESPIAEAWQALTDDAPENRPVNAWRSKELEKAFPKKR